MWSGHFWYGRDLIDVLLPVPSSPTPAELGPVLVSFTSAEIRALSPHRDVFRPEPLPIPRPPTPPLVDDLPVSLFDEDSDRPNPQDPYIDPVDSYDPRLDLYLEEAVAYVDESVATVSPWPPPTVMPLCLRPYVDLILPHPLCPGYYHIRGRAERLMLAESRHNPGHVGVYADASFARLPESRPVSFAQRVAFAEAQVVSSYEGVRYESYDLYALAMRANLGLDASVAPYLWESDSSPYFVVDGRPLVSGSLTYTSFFNEGFERNRVSLARVHLHGIWQPGVLAATTTLYHEDELLASSAPRVPRLGAVVAVPDDPSAVPDLIADDDSDDYSDSLAADVPYGRDVPDLLADDDSDTYPDSSSADDNSGRDFPDLLADDCTRTRFLWLNRRSVS